jgi:hypothetical protein
MLFRTPAVEGEVMEVVIVTDRKWVYKSAPGAQSPKVVWRKGWRTEVVANM